MRAGAALLLLALLAGGVWQMSRYAAFSMAMPDRMTEAPEGLPQTRALTLFGASNFSGGALRDGLAEALAGCGVQVRVVARGGASSDWGIAHLEEALQAGGVVIMDFVGNDSSMVHGMPLRRSLENHRLIFERARRAGVVMLLPTGRENRLRGLPRAARPGFMAYREKVGTLGLAMGAGLFDAGRRWQEIDATLRDRLMPDGLHATPEATRAISLPAYEAAVRPLLCP